MAANGDDVMLDDIFQRKWDETEWEWWPNALMFFSLGLNPTIGREIQKKTRPRSTAYINNSVGTLIVAPMTSRGGDYPSRDLSI
jgi:hypothetical protein